MKADTITRYVGSAAASAAAVMVMAPTPALAAEQGINAILPKMDEFIPMLIAFIILWIILAKFGWPVFERMLTKRETTISDSLKKADEAQVEAERTLAEYKKQLEEARSQSQQIVADAKATGEAVKADITARAQEEADAMIEKARAAIEAERKAAVAELRGSVADLSVSVASRVIGEDLSDDEHRKIIERYLDEVGSFNAN